MEGRYCGDDLVLSTDPEGALRAAKKKRRVQEAIEDWYMGPPTATALRFVKQKPF